MNIKEFIFPLVVALSITGFIQYYFEKKNVEKKQESTFVASRVAQAERPLNLEIDFVDTCAADSQATHVKLDLGWGLLTFGNGAVNSIVYKKHETGKMIQSFELSDKMAHESQMFLLALEQKTPCNYKLIKNEEINGSHVLTYQAPFTHGTITKQFTVETELPVVTLHCTFDIKGTLDKSINTRLFVPGPTLPAHAEYDQISSVVYDAKGEFKKDAIDQAISDRGWLAPQFFGLDSKYFVHALITDPGHYVQRAYYRVSGVKQATSIFELSPITQTTSYEFSFYVGPKDVDLMGKVDPRLDKTLDYYGWFSGISKILLRMLKWLYGYVHNYGLAIIVITFLMKLIMLPLALRSDSSMKKQREMQKKLAHLQQKYKNDPETLQRERTELIKQHGVPGLGGCLPMLLQVPLFFALSRLLANSIELYQAPMLWIPDLSSKDPFYVFPVLVTVGMLASAVQADDKQKLSVIAVALIFGALTANFSAGLALYITVNTVMGVAQTHILRFFGFTSQG